MRRVNVYLSHTLHLAYGAVKIAGAAWRAACLLAAAASLSCCSNVSRAVPPLLPPFPPPDLGGDAKSLLVALTNGTMQVFSWQGKVRRGPGWVMLVVGDVGAK